MWIFVGEESLLWRGRLLALGWDGLVVRGGWRDRRDVRRKEGEKRRIPF